MYSSSEKRIRYFMLGLCPALAISTTVRAGFFIGLITLIVILLSNTVIYLVRNKIPDEIKTAIFVIVIATFVTGIQILLECYQPELRNELGLALPLVVVNGTVLGCVEGSAYKNKIGVALKDGLRMGLAFLVVITLISSIRELFGQGSLYGVTILPEGIRPIGIAALAPGAFFVLAILIAMANKWNLIREMKTVVQKNRVIENREESAEEEEADE